MKYLNIGLNDSRFLHAQRNHNLPILRYGENPNYIQPLLEYGERNGDKTDK
jgi:hypothetical protein